MNYFTNAAGRPTRRKTRALLGPRFGVDSGKILFLALEGGDTITLWPSRARDPSARAHINALDLYHLLISRRNGCHS